MSQRHKPDVELDAFCACGAVHLTFSGAVRAMFLCSCEDCQRATGTGHASIALVPIAEVGVSGETKSFTRPANSGATLARHFCPVCGTALFAQSSRAPSLAMLPAGLFGANTDWFVPSQLIFARSHRDWDTLPEGLPRHSTYRDEGAH